MIRQLTMNFRCVTLFFLLWPGATLQRSHRDSPTYIAATVEYSPVIHSKHWEKLGEINAKNYLKIIDKAASYAIDVIVFPESSLAIPSKENITFTRSQLASYIPDPKDNVIPCTDTSKHYAYTIKSMSCAARDYQIYIVVNHREKVDCTPGEKGCPRDDNLLIYNTNVAFNRDGRVVARYRKYNLFFDEKQVNITNKPIPTTFVTDFGVTFGTFICFDIIFTLPPMNLTRDLGITDILYSTHWFETPPFIFSTAAQAAWAYANDVNLMVSGHNFPRTGSGGSGIYLGQQGYVDVVSEKKRSNVLLVAEIPKVINGKRTRNIDRSKLHRYEFTKEEIITGGKTVAEDVEYRIDPTLKYYTTQLINLMDGRQNKTICSPGLCCDFKLTIDFDRSIVKNNSNFYRYRFATMNDALQKMGLGQFGYMSCAIIACVNDTSDGCGIIFKNHRNTITPTTFRSLEISTSNIANDEYFVSPMTYTHSMLPLNVTDFTFTSVNFGTVSTYRMVLEKPVNLLSFAIFGRTSAIDRTLNSNSE